MTRLQDRRSMVHDIAVAQSAGARLLPACLIVGITLRTLQRWQGAAGENGVVSDARPLAVRPVPAHALSAAERAQIVSRQQTALCFDTTGADRPDAGRRRHLRGQRSEYPARAARPWSNAATRPRQGAPSRAPTDHPYRERAEGSVVLGHDLSARAGARQWFYLYLIFDLYSRKIVGSEVQATDDSMTPPTWCAAPRWPRASMP